MKDISFKLTKYIGDQNNKLNPSKYTTLLKPKSFIILTSDGFHDVVPIKKFQEIVNKHQFESLPKILIDEANKESGRDNITAVVTMIER